MKHITRSSPSNIGLAALLAAGMMSGAAHNAVAAGTASGTIIGNLATLAYSVDGAAQLNIGSSPTGNSLGAGTATTFLVDNKVNLTVAEVGGSLTTTGVVPGSVDRITTFTVTNNGNTLQDYVLTVGQGLSTQTLFGGTDNFDVTGCNRFVESNAIPDGYQAGSDTAIFIDELAADASKQVYVLCTVPVAQINGDVSLVSLLATTHNGGAAGQGALTAEDTGVDVAGAVQVVFADINAGDAQGDNAARNGSHSARDGYEVTTSVISVRKTAVLLCDPFNGATNPKNIPGSITRWTIQISNTGAASATLGTIADTLHANTTHDANLVTGLSAVACVSASPGVPENAAGKGFQVEYSVLRALGGTGGLGYLTNVADADGATIAGQVVTIDFATALPAGGAYAAGELKAGENTTVTFNITVN